MTSFEKFFITILSILLFGILSYTILTPKDVIIKEEPEYVYYKQYSWWGLDSCIYKYHKPIYYDGKIIYKDINTFIRGVAGKGGHWETETTIIISFDNRKYEDNINEFGSQSTVRYNTGDRVIVKEIFYPHYKIEYWK